MDAAAQAVPTAAPTHPEADLHPNAFARLRRVRAGLGERDGIRPSAAHALGGAGGPLPFLERIQAAFGRFDVTQVRAHTDAAAAEGTAAIGARAFTSAGEVAFGRPPDLHTAAHEAAHVVQQRHGVTVDGGVGSPADAFERHADAVADAVAAGRPAESLLARLSGRRQPAGAATPVIQMLTDEQEEALDKYVYELESELGIQSLQLNDVKAKLSELKKKHTGSKPKDLLAAKAELREWMKGLKPKQSAVSKSPVSSPAQLPSPAPSSSSAPGMPMPTSNPAMTPAPATQAKQTKKKKPAVMSLKEAGEKFGGSGPPLGASFAAMASKPAVPGAAPATAPVHVISPAAQTAITAFRAWHPTDHAHGGRNGMTLTLTDLRDIMADADTRSPGNYYFLRGDGSGAPWTGHPQLKIIHRVEMSGDKHCTYHIRLTPTQLGGLTEVPQSDGYAPG
jgi:hypothetical protein